MKRAAIALGMTLAIVGPPLARAEDWQFRPVEDSGLPRVGATFGGTWADLDLDGHWDLILSRHADDGLEFYLGRGDLSFFSPENATVPAGLLDPHGTAACDHDGDGDWDLFLSVGADRGQGPSCKQLWLNTGALAFVNDVTCDHLLADAKGRGRGAVWLRLDSAPLPQLVLLNYRSPPRLFGRDGDGVWRDLADRLGSSRESSWNVAVADDLDGDGATDLFAAGNERRILRNGDGRLAAVTVEALPVEGPGVSAAASGDVDGDGDPDLVLGLRGGGMWLLRNESVPGRIRFDGPVGYPDLPQVQEPVSVALADLDNDGWLDLVVAQRDPALRNLAPLLARGRGDGTFEKVPAADTGLGAVPSRAMAIWAWDLDHDGDLDLVVINGETTGVSRRGAVLVYENLARTPGVTVELVAAPGAAPHGLGARVRLRSGDRVQSQRVRSVANPWNATVPPVHFGLGGAEGPSELTVDWPAGGRLVTTVPETGGRYRFTEGNP